MRVPGSGIWGIVGWFSR